MLEDLYEIQRLLVAEMPEKDTNTRKALDIVDNIIDELQAEENGI